MAKDDLCADCKTDMNKQKIKFVVTNYENRAQILLCEPCYFRRKGIKPR